MNYPVIIGGLAVLYFFLNMPSALEPNKKTFTLYWWNKCGHCTKFMPEWRMLGWSVNGISIRSIEASQNNELKVQGFPTMVYRDGKGNMETYTGERSARAITQYLMTK
jgi:hypothetical protein